MDLHLKSTIQKVRSILYKLSKVRSMIDEATALKNCKSYVLPILEFGLYMLDNFYKGHVSKLKKIQNKCLRLCFPQDSWYPAYPLHLRADLLPLRLRRECCILNLLNKKLIKGDGTFEVDERISNRALGGTKVVMTFLNWKHLKDQLPMLGPQCGINFLLRDEMHYIYKHFNATTTKSK